MIKQVFIYTFLLAYIYTDVVLFDLYCKKSVIMSDGEWVAHQHSLGH